MQNININCYKSRTLDLPVARTLPVTENIHTVLFEFQISGKGLDDCSTSNLFSVFVLSSKSHVPFTCISLNSWFSVDRRDRRVRLTGCNPAHLQKKLECNAVGCVFACVWLELCRCWPRSEEMRGGQKALTAGENTFTRWEKLPVSDDPSVFAYVSFFNVYHVLFVIWVSLTVWFLFRCSSKVWTWLLQITIVK